MGNSSKLGSCLSSVPGGARCARVCFILACMRGRVEVTVGAVERVDGYRVNTLISERHKAPHDRSADGHRMSFSRASVQPTSSRRSRCRFLRACGLQREATKPDNHEKNKKTLKSRCNAKVRTRLEMTDIVELLNRCSLRIAIQVLACAGMHALHRLSYARGRRGSSFKREKTWKRP